MHRMVAEDHPMGILSEAETHSAADTTKADVISAEGALRLGMVGLGAAGAPRPKEVVAPIRASIFKTCRNIITQVIMVPRQWC